MNKKTPEITDISNKLYRYTKDNPTPNIKSHYKTNEIRELDNYMLSQGFEFLNTGLDRRVYSNGQIAIKIEVGSNDQNKREISRIMFIPKNQKKYYNLPIAYDKSAYNWLIVPLAKTDGNSTSIAWKTLEKLKDSNCIGSDDFSEWHNIGLVNGKPKIIDFGF